MNAFHINFSELKMFVNFYIFSYIMCHISLCKNTITLASSEISYFCEVNGSKKVGAKHILNSKK